MKNFTIKILSKITNIFHIFIYEKIIKKIQNKFDNFIQKKNLKKDLVTITKLLVFNIFLIFIIVIELENVVKLTVSYNYPFIITILINLTILLGIFFIT